MSKNCECGDTVCKGSHLCFDCREDALAGVKSNIAPKLNRSDDGSPIADHVLRSCGLKPTWESRG